MTQKRSVGLVVISVPDDVGKEVITSMAELAFSCVAPGRTVAALWNVPHDWRETAPVEGWLTDVVLGSPESRVESKDVGTTFYGNLVVRGYRRDDVRPSSTHQVLLFRAAGPSVRERAKEDGALLDAALLDTRAYAFTRDYANNVWHVRDKRVASAVASRLVRLLAWPDEAVVIVDSSMRAKHLLRHPTAPAGDLVGVPEKYEYPWSVNGHQQLALIDT